MSTYERCSLMLKRIATTRAVPVALILAIFAISPLAAQAPLRLAGTEAPATEGSADVYPGTVAVRSLVDGYVVAVSGEWGSATLLLHAPGVVTPVAELDPRGTLLVRVGELVAVLPGSGQVLRLTLPTTGPQSLAAPLHLAKPQIDRLHARYGTTDLLEEVSRNVISYTPAVEGLNVDTLLAVEDLEAAVAAAFTPPSPATDLQTLVAGAFNQTPPDDGGDGCSSSCSVTCPPTNNRCTATTGGTSCCSCSCSRGSASCSCR